MCLPPRKFLADARRLMEQAEWIDGRATAGYQSAKAKDNMQIREGDPMGKTVGCHHPEGSRQQSALCWRRRCRYRFSRLSLTVTRVVNLSARMSITPSGRFLESGHRIRTDISATLVSRVRVNMAAATCAWRTLTVCER